MTRTGWFLCAVLLLAGGVRLAGARTPIPELIERDEFIPASMTLSLDHHPIRLAQHGALPAYTIRLSGLLFGDTLFGRRILNAIAGTLTVLLLFSIAARWWGPVAGLTAAALLALERYHMRISARAIDLPLDLFFVTLALFAFSRFLWTIKQVEVNPQPKWLYLTAAACALGFLCKEFTALLLPALLLSLAMMGRRVWLKRREVWLAIALFVVMISPDVYSSLTITREERLDLWRRHQAAAALTGVIVNQPAYAENGLYMSYGDQLSRFRGFGFNQAPFHFYFGGALDALGIAYENTFTEFPFMHPIQAMLLWLGVLYALGSRGKDPLTIALLTMFVLLFVPFTLVRLGSPRARFPSDPVALWYWVDRTMLPAMLLTGRAVGRLVDQLSDRRGRPEGPSS